MRVKSLMPILNVSDMDQSFEWFGKLGWTKEWELGEPVEYGRISSGDCQILLCHNAQGGRGRGSATTTFGASGESVSDKGVWMTLWVDDVDEVYRECLVERVEITWAPTDMPWKVREMHVRHPDGHVFRISSPL